MRVCVIGAGASGLICAHHLHNAGVEHTVFEQTAVPSGTWVYEENGDADNAHSSMYRDLRTNLPVEVMAYPGHPYPPGATLFAHHSTVRAYFDAFYRHNVAPHRTVRFRTRVVEVRRGVTAPWDVEVDAEGERRVESFTHIMVCNGKYSVPRVPNVPGLDTFTGRIEHSHGYRVRDKYAGQRVVVVGGGFSGIDIALEVSTVTTECVLAHRQPDRLNLPGVAERGAVTRVSGSRVFFGPDESAVDDVDCLMFCTGYRISVPFLEQYVAVDDGFRVRGLYRHSIVMSEPTIAFIGLPSRILPCLVFDYQARYAISVFTGLRRLPDKPAMLAELAADARRRDELGLSAPKFAHDLRGPLLWEYLQRFVDDGFDPPSTLYRRGYEAAHAARKQDLVGYRDVALTF